MTDAQPCPCGRADCQLAWAAHDWSALDRFGRDPLAANDPAPRDEIDFIVDAAFDAAMLDEHAPERSKSPEDRDD